MKKDSSIDYLRPLLLRPGFAFICLLEGLLQPALAQRLEIHADASRRIVTFQARGNTGTNNAFFQNLGTNGRTCFTCHQPQDGWTLSAASARARFEASEGDDPLFRPVDGATCPTDDVSTLDAKEQAYKLLIDRGLIRIDIALPPQSDLPPPEPNLQFEVTNVDDPYGCTTLTSKTTGTVSVYRRPLPATNLGFLTTIMWDGREPSLKHQAIDATLGHAQGGLLSDDQQRRSSLSRRASSPPKSSITKHTSYMPLVQRVAPKRFRSS